MKTRTVSSLFLLSVLVAGMIATTPSVFADHPRVILEPLPGSSTIGCEQTDEGCYNIPILTISPGTEVVFINTDNAAHTLTAGSTSEGPSGAFDSGLVMVNAEYAFTLDEPGVYEHYCIVHPWMSGQIIVDADAVAEDPVMDDPMEDPVMDDPMEDPVMDDPMEDPVMDDPMEDPVMDDPMEDPVMDNPTDNGGCLIATATFGSELAPQVQQLRELRDNTVLATASGTAFMSGFNQFYYTFSPAVADLERENPAFKEAMKIILTPMLSSLSLLNYAEIDTESEMLGYGISAVLLNLGMYVGIPAFAILKCTKLVQARLHTKKSQKIM